mgnify:CR=1 FL=1
MAIKPILMNTEMVRAILDGRKNCIRRVIKHNTEAVLNSTYHMEHPEIEDAWLIRRLCRAPYDPGDVLYVRETWDCYPEYEDENAPAIYYYKADGDLRPEGYREIGWLSPIHMPKEAARIWLKVTDVRVERLQDITEDEAKAEGMPDSLDYPVDKAYCPLCKGEGIIGTVDVHSLGHMDVDCPYCDSYRKRFENLWNSINQKCLDRYGWDSNPFVWVIEFDRCETPKG